MTDTKREEKTAVPKETANAGAAAGASEAKGESKIIVVKGTKEARRERRREKISEEDIEGGYYEVPAVWITPDGKMEDLKFASVGAAVEEAQKRIGDVIDCGVISRHEKRGYRFAVIADDAGVAKKLPLNALAGDFYGKSDIYGPAMIIDEQVDSTFNSSDVRRLSVL